MMFRSGVLKSGALLSVLLTMGCLPKTEISAAKMADYKITTDRLLLLETMYPTNDVQQSFNVKFPSQLQSCGLQSYIAGVPVANSLASGPNASNPSAEEIQKTAAALIVQNKLDTVLKVHFKSMQFREKFGVRGNAIRYIYDVSLDGTNGKAFWKSEINLLPDNIKQGDMTGADNPALVGSALADAVFEQMKSDNLFLNCHG